MYDTLCRLKTAGVTSLLNVMISGEHRPKFCTSLHTNEIFSSGLKTKYDHLNILPQSIQKITCSMDYDPYDKQEVQWAHRSYEKRHFFNKHA